MKLELEQPSYYRLKKGQSLADVANVYGVPPRALAALNGLKEEPREGSVLQLPAERRDLYTVRGGESKTLLCGSAENFEKRNGTKCLNIGQTVWL